jgi:hypothetical protein
MQYCSVHVSKVQIILEETTCIQNKKKGLFRYITQPVTSVQNGIKCTYGK